MSHPVIEHPSAVLERIAAFIHNTPVFHQESLDEKLGAQVYLKGEHLQKVGAFKARGAVNALLQLPEEVRHRGAATHSSGNHGQALAWAGKKLGMPVYVVMPTNAPQAKRNAVAGYGATIVDCAPTLEARESTLAGVVAQTGATFVPPFDHAHIVAGQGTAAWELLQSHPDLTDIIAPVGGGGLLSGTLNTVVVSGKTIRVWGAEPEGAADAWESMEKGVRMPLTNTQTICDGLRTSLGEIPFALLNKRVTGILRVADAATVDAMHWLFERTKQVVEPSGAIALAAIMVNQPTFAGKKVGVILSGGNTDLATLPF